MPEESPRGQREAIHRALLLARRRCRVPRRGPRPWRCRRPATPRRPGPAAAPSRRSFRRWSPRDQETPPLAPLDHPGRATTTTTRSTNSRTTSRAPWTTSTAWLPRERELQTSTSSDGPGSPTPAPCPSGGTWRPRVRRGPIRPVLVDRRAAQVAWMPQVVERAGAVQHAAVVPDHEIAVPPPVAVDELRLGPRTSTAPAGTPALRRSATRRRARRGRRCTRWGARRPRCEPSDAAPAA